MPNQIQAKSRNFKLPEISYMLDIQVYDTFTCSISPYL